MERVNVPANNTEVISTADAIAFVKNKLGIQNVHELLREDRKQLLDIICITWQHTIPFHTLKQLSLPVPRRDPPTEKEAVDDVTSGLGGLCGTHATAACSILKALGYDCYMALSSVFSEQKNHVVVFIQNLKEDGDLFLFEVGIGYPTFKVVQVKSAHGFIVDTGEFENSICTFKYMKEDDKYIRYHKLSISGDSTDRLGRVYPADKENVWGQHSVVYLTPVEFTDCWLELRENVYANMEDRFNHIILACKYPEGKHVGIKNNDFRFEDEFGNVKKNPISDKESMISTLNQYFPEIPDHIVIKALENIEFHDQQKI